jgi:hypothetical protein
VPRLTRTCRRPTLLQRCRGQRAGLAVTSPTTPDEPGDRPCPAASAKRSAVRLRSLCLSDIPRTVVRPPPGAATGRTRRSACRSQARCRQRLARHDLDPRAPERRRFCAAFGLGLILMDMRSSQKACEAESTTPQAVAVPPPTTTPAASPAPSLKAPGGRLRHGNPSDDPRPLPAALCGWLLLGAVLLCSACVQTPLPDDQESLMRLAGSDDLAVQGEAVRKLNQVLASRPC